MSSISSPKGGAQFNLSGLTTMAGNVGDNDKIRGKTTGMISKSDVLYSSSKSHGKMQTGKRPEKQQKAQDFINHCLTNTLATFPLGKQQALTIAFNNILQQHNPGQGADLTGQGLKAIVAEANQAIADYDFNQIMHDADQFIQAELSVPTPPPVVPPYVGLDPLDQQASQLNKSTSYNETTVRTPGNLVENTSRVRDLTIEKHNQSVYRLPNKLDFKITDANGVTHQVAKIAGNPPNREVFLGAMFKQINTALGRPGHDIQERVTNYSKFGTGGTQEHLNAFSGGIRSDNGDNQDIFLLKFATKEMAALSIVSVFQGLQAYCNTNNIPGQYNIPMRDQVESCHITLDNHGNFDVESSLTVPLQDADRQPLGSVKMTMLAHVDSQTGDVTYDVRMSDMRFTPEATDTDKQHLYAAMNSTLPFGV